MTDQEYIRIHKDDPVRPLALRPMPEGVNRTWVLQQIEGYQLAKKKLPHWAAIYDEGKDLHFPPRLSLEQCSSEATAKYKAQVLSTLTSNLLPLTSQLSTLIDLTGGFGVDFSYLAPHFSRAVYVEQQAVLCDVARHNLPLLGISNAEVINLPSEEALATVFSPSGEVKGELEGVFFFLDPARRDSAGNKVFCLEDCSPDITLLQDTLLNIGDAIMVKLSPMLDITQALRQLRCVTDVHVISVKGECKELLIIMRKDKAPDQPITFHCVNLETEEDSLMATLTDSPPAPLLERGEEYALSFIEKTDKTFCNCSPLSKSFCPSGNEGTRGESVRGESLFLFEPNASILKAGLQDVFGERYGLSKLHPNSNLFVGKEPIPRVPARQFRIVDITDFSKAGLKRLLKDISKANLTIRNFPATVQELRKRLKLKEGGSDYLFATTLSDGSHVLIRCIKEQ